MHFQKLIDAAPNRWRRLGDVHLLMVTVACLSGMGTRPGNLTEVFAAAVHPTYFHEGVSGAPQAQVDQWANRQCSRKSWLSDSRARTRGTRFSQASFRLTWRRSAVQSGRLSEAHRRKAAVIAHAEGIHVPRRSGTGACSPARRVAGGNLPTCFFHCVSSLGIGLFDRRDLFRGKTLGNDLDIAQACRHHSAGAAVDRSGKNPSSASGLNEQSPPCHLHWI